MSEAGFVKDREGFFAARTGERFRPELLITAGPEIERTQTLMTDFWRRAGFDIQPAVLSVAATRDRETRHTFPSLGYRGGQPAGERTWTSVEIGTAATRWAGENRAGWSSPEYDRAWEAFLISLERSERIHHHTEMMRLLSDQLPTFLIYFSVQVMAVASNLHGVEAGSQGVGSLVRESLHHGNIHEWELR